MKKFTFCLFFLVLCIFDSFAQDTFALTRLQPIAITSSTKEKPQAKVWTYAGRWWCVLSTSAGTRVFRLDSTAWTPVLTLNTTSSSNPDCRVAGDLVHVLLYKGSDANSFIYTLQYDTAGGTYKPWVQRPKNSTLRMPVGSRTATLVVDGTGRMWVATDTRTSIQVYWSDAPYTTFSAPITLAANVTDDDICSVAALQGRVGVFWSNQNAKRFAFSSHGDGADPADWQPETVPAFTPAADNVGQGMANNHLNVKTGSDGTLYCAAKTNYKNTAYPRIFLLVRRPNGSWEAPYTATTGLEGDKPIVLLNEKQGKLKVLYTSRESGGDILYRESSASNIAFGPPRYLLSTPAQVYDYTTSTHQNYNSEIVVLATNITTSAQQAEGVLGVDKPADITAPAVDRIERQDPAAEAITAAAATFRVVFSEPVRGVDAADFTLVTTHAASGTITSVTGSGATYDVQVTAIAGSGNISLAVNDSGTGITDAVGNDLGAGFTGGQTYSIVPSLTSVSIASGNSNPALSRAGDAVTLGFTASGAITAPAVTIAGQAAPVVEAGPNSFTATYTLAAADAAGVLPFTIDFSNAAGTAGAQVTATTNGSTVTFDPVPPALTGILRHAPATDHTSDTSVVFRVRFSESVTGVDGADFVPLGTAGGSVTAVSGSDTAFEVTVSDISGSGTLGLGLAAGAGITDAAGNGIPGTYSEGQTFTVYHSIPTLSLVTLSSGNGTPSLARTGDTVTLNFMASEPLQTPLVTVFAQPVSVSAGNDPDSYTAAYTVTGSEEAGPVPFTIDFFSSAGARGVQVTATTNGSTVTFDKTVPVATAISRQAGAPEQTNAGTVVFRVTFSEPVTGVEAADFTFGGTVSGSLAVAAVDSTHYEVTVSGITESGVLRLDLAVEGTGIADAAGNPVAGGYTAGESYRIDREAPLVVQVSRLAGAAEYATAGPVVFALTFSEPVTGVEATAFSLSTSHTLAAAIASITGSGDTWQVTVVTGSGSGTISLGVNASGTGITDAVGNGLGDGFAGGQTYTIVPSLTSVRIASGNSNPAVAREGDGVTLSFTASEPLQAPAVTIAAQAVPVVEGVPGSYTATYTLAATDAAGLVPFLVTWGGNGGTAGVQASATTDGSSVTFDPAAPVVRSLNRQPGAPEYTSDTSVTFLLEFSEPVTGVDTSDFAVQGEAGGTLAAVSGNGSTYTVTVSGITGLGTLGLQVKSSDTGILDGAGNGLNGGYTGGQTYTLQPVVMPEVLYREGFENPTWFPKATLQTSTAYGFTVVANPSFAEAKVGRWELRDTDPTVNSGTRAEMHLGAEFALEESWFSFAGYFPAAQYLPDADDEAINQWHQGSEVSSPMLTLRTKSGAFQVRRRLPDESGNVTYKLGAIPYDQWVEFVIHLKQHPTDGIFQLWINGVLKLDYKGPTMYPGSYGRWKVGVYKSDWNGTKTTATKERVWYIDDVKVGNLVSTYATMKPQGSNVSALPPAALAKAAAGEELQASAGAQARQPQVYPTLVKRGGVITVKTLLPGTTEAFVTDISGRILSRLRITGTGSIETGNLPGGLYFINLRGKDGISRKKFLVAD